MRYLFISFYIILISTCITSCKKAISIQNQQENIEERLNVTINPDPGSSVAVALSESFSYQLLIVHSDESEPLIRQSEPVEI